MTKVYAQERSKYCNLTVQIIIWPVTYASGNPESSQQISQLPAGYLKCDGTKYYERDYPELALVIGTGAQCKFTRKNLDGTDYDALADTQFMVPDLGSKYPEPTSGANAGVYNSIREKNAIGTEVSRSGIGIEATSEIGDEVRLTYSGEISVPTQEIQIRGKPSYTAGGTTGRTDNETVDDVQLHPHAHFHQGQRARNLQTNESSTNHPQPAGDTGRNNTSTVYIEDWLDATRFHTTKAVTGYNNSSTRLDGSSLSSFSMSSSDYNPPGSAQEQCKAIKPWRSDAITFQGFFLYNQSTSYWGSCIGSGDQVPLGGCLNRIEYKLTRGARFGGDLLGSPDGNNTATWGNDAQTIFGICLWRHPNPQQSNADLTVPATYVAGAPGMPVDWNNSSCHDVLPLQGNQSFRSSSATPDIYNNVTETPDLVQTTNPTIHSHRVRIKPDMSVNGGLHTYKAKTRAISISPENLSTTMTIGADADVSIDSACAPFIVMEYLIKF